MTQQPTDTGTVYPLKIADARHSVRHVFVRDLNVDVNIGIHAHERRGRQRVIVNVDLSVTEAERPVRDKIGDVLCYEEVAAGIERIVAEGHINLVETLAERIAGIVRNEFNVPGLRLRVSKPGAVTGSRDVGVVIERGEKL